jgi:formate dehydrogenase (NADP+) beta subunit
VTVISLESRDEMPAHEFEVEEAEHEGIAFVPRRGPARIVERDGKVAGIETIGVTSVFDADGRFAPVFDDDDRRVFDADTVILAIGQAIDLDALGEHGPEVSPRRTIQIDNDTGRTSAGRLGRRRRGQGAPHPHRRHRRRPSRPPPTSTARSAATKRRRSRRRSSSSPSSTARRRLRPVDRVAVPTLDTGRRIGLAEVELGFTPEQARCEAARCLRCFANIILDVTSACCARCAPTCARST